MSEDTPAVSVRYLVDAIAPAVAFYTRELGFEARLVADPEIAVLRRGGLQLVLSGPASSAARPVEGVQPVPGGWNRIQLVVDDLCSMTQRLAAAGVAVRCGPTEGRAGRQVVVDDPSGNPLELFEPKGGDR
jgi:catechol 2,3-dioxygenase-like lactoylglutathione lyase family enzyme